MATPKELATWLWGVLFAIAGYGAGFAQQYLNHRNEHRVRHSSTCDVCATLCDDLYAPRALCLHWADQNATDIGCR